MNTNWVIFNLVGADSDLLEKDLKKRVTDQDVFALAIYYEHMLYHICCAWNTRNMNDETIDNISSSEEDSYYDKLHHAVPNFNNKYRIADIHYRDRVCWKESKNKNDRLNNKLMSEGVQNYNSHKNKLIEMIEKYGSIDEDDLKVGFMNIIDNLCLSWHAKWIDRTVFNYLKDDEIAELKSTIPQWNEMSSYCNFYLIPDNEEVAP